MEVVFEEIVDREISLMSYSNTRDYCEGVKGLDDDALLNNLIHGACALSAMCDYLESSINTIIRVVYLPSGCIDERCREMLESRVGNLTSQNVSDKVRFLVEDGRLAKDPRQFDRRIWNKAQDVKKLRNELIAHYKASYVSECSIPDPETWLLPNKLSFVNVIPQMNANENSIGLQITRPAMEKSWTAIRRLVQIIAEEAGCMIKPDTRVVEADGRDGFCTYIVPKDAFLGIYPDGFRH